jgi:DNA-binding NtrC family response regulator
MITAHDNAALAFAAMKSGLDEYLTKPLSLETLGVLVQRLLSQQYRPREIGTSPAHARVRAGPLEQRI